MADQTPAELAELSVSVLPALPHGVTSPLPGDPARTEPVLLEALEGEMFVARWERAQPDIGTERELRVTGEHAVYLLTVEVAALGPDGHSRMLRVTNLRRRRQRRSEPRAEVRDLVLVTTDRDVDAELVDVSSGGVAFILDRPLEIDQVIRAVLNVHGRVIPTEACVKQITSVADGYRIGCLFSEISDAHRSELGRHAALNPVDRRVIQGDRTLRQRLFLTDEPE
jgi:PilZ domain-containing protein